MRTSATTTGCATTACWRSPWAATTSAANAVCGNATDDPLHGRQEGRFFHGYYDCYCYLPLYVTCGPHLLCGRLRRSNRDAADGAVEELQRIVGQIRQRWPRVRVVVRGDAGFCRDELMAWCEAAEGVDYVFGLAQNARLKRALAQPGAGQRAGVAAVPRFPLSDAGELEPQVAGGGPGGVAAGRGARGQPALRGDQPGAGADRDPAAVRAAVLRARGHGYRKDDVQSAASSCTARAGTWTSGSRERIARSQLYCARGDMENRIKEQQLDLFADRTSAATRRANQLRLYWALFAAALLEVLRQRGLAGTELARAQCGTIRALLLKVAVVVRVSGRRAWVSLSSVFPRQELFAHSLARLRAETPG